MRGRFITLEGGEGTGKSTLIVGLQEALSNRGIDCVITREPGGTVLAEALRTLVLNPPADEGWSPLGQALLMNAAREDHLERLIKPMLDAGKWVISDRFSDSTRVYQGIQGVAADVLTQLEEFVISQTRPDLTLILDGNPADLLDRRAGRGTQDTFEDRDLEFHNLVRTGFLKVAETEPERCVVIDALASRRSVLQRALSAIETRLVAP